MRRAVVLIALAGCDLVFPPGGGPGGTPDAALDDAAVPTPDADLAHNEDRDAFLDFEDGCPHLSTVENLDDDGDGVGDECDPQPSLPNQQRELFASFAGGLDGLVSSVPVTFDQDDVIVDVTGMLATLYLPSALQEVDIFTHVTFEAVDTGAQRAEIMPVADHHGPDGGIDGVSCRVGRTLLAPANVYIELHQQAVGGADSTLNTASTGGPLDNLETDVHFLTRKVGNELGCDVGGMLILDKPPAAFVGGRLGLAIRSATVRFSYLFIVGRRP